MLGLEIIAQSTLLIVAIVSFGFILIYRMQALKEISRQVIGRSIFVEKILVLVLFLNLSAILVSGFFILNLVNA